MGTMAGKLKGVFAAMGGAFVLKGIVDKFDRIGKVAKRVGMSAEEVQRLGYAAELTGTNFETLQGIMTRIQRRIGEALTLPTSAAAQAMKELGLSATDLGGKDLTGQFLAVADAFKKTGGSVEGVASLMKLLDTEVRNLIPLFLEGSDGIQGMMSKATVASDDTVQAIEDIKDALTELGNVGGSTFANMISGAMDMVRGMGEALGFLMALGEAALPGTEFTVDEIITAGRVRGQAESDRKAKLFDDEIAAEKAEKDEKARLQKERERKEIENLRLTSPAFQGKIKEAFAAVGEDPFKDAIDEFDKRFVHKAPGLKDVEKKAAPVSGKFGEFLQTAGLGGTSYVRKTPAIVQLEKQTKLSEKMVQSLDDFHASLDDLVGNTVER